jgi:hypothetical protein
MSENPRLCYFTYGTSAGYYHYALNQLRGLHESHPELDIDVFYVGADDNEHFPDYVSERHFVYTGNDSKIMTVLRTVLLQFRLFIYLLRAHPDVVQMNTHLRTQWYTLYITVLLNVFRVPAIRTVHERTEGSHKKSASKASRITFLRLRSEELPRCYSIGNGWTHGSNRGVQTGGDGYE